MEKVVWFFAAIGVLIFVFFIISVVLGNFGDKRKMGKQYLKKKFRNMGMDPTSFTDEQIMRVSTNAYGVMEYGPHSTRRFDNPEFIRQLDFRAELIYAHFNGVSLDKDSKGLVDTLLNLRGNPIS